MLAPPKRKVQHMIGKKFGRLTVIELLGCNEQGRSFYLCHCECGEQKNVLRQSLVSGVTLSCGCLNKEIMTTHGMSRDKEYFAWQSMIARCYRKTCDAYKWYGSRGIRVCDKWRESFDAFIEDMGHAPTKKHSIDRIDSDGDYTPENCRWATDKQQNGNRRGVVKITYKGRTECLAEWSRITGLNYSLLQYRIKKGWDIEKVLTTAPMENMRRG